jgi:hypothetical protein
MQDVVKKENKKNPSDISRMKKGDEIFLREEKYTVTEYAEYDWGEGFITQEWGIKSEKGLFFVRREREEKTFMTFSERINSSETEELFEYLKHNMDPPGELKFSNYLFHLEDSGAGYFCPDGKRPGKDCVMWLMADKNSGKILTVFQWSNEKFSCFLGEEIEENEIELVKSDTV